MILGVRCSDPRFKSVSFRSGLNVVLADRTREATRKDTRNGLGKSTLIEVIHYCLGSGPQRGTGLLIHPLSGWNFSLDLDVGASPMSISRSTTAPQTVLLEGDTSGWPIQPRATIFGSQELSVTDWCRLLGAVMFDLPITPQEHRVTPTFRGLISYFSRKGRDAYSNPFEHHRKQSEAEKQVYNAFLLGLDWTYASEWQALRDRKRILDEIRKASQNGLVDGVLGSPGELEAVRIRLEARVRQEMEQLSSFRVHPQYEEIEKRANELTEEIHELSNANVADTALAGTYRDSLRAEREPPSEDISLLYEEAGVALPGVALRRLDEVQRFHQQVISNRRQFLAREVERIEREIILRREMISLKDQERASLMETLRTHGALAEYTRLQQLHTATVAELRNVEQRLRNVRAFQRDRSDLAIEQELLQQRASQDLSERVEQKREAIELFNSNSEFLYDAPGSLVIDIGPSGYRFSVEIERSGSQGISSMKVFCYDLMLAQLWAGRQHSPGFLIHDSTIFDGVDERQIALALELADRESRRFGFQYICTLNSDTIPWGDFSPGFDLQDFVRLRLTDETDEGGLLGIRY